MHPRVGLHQVAFLDSGTTTFVEHCRRVGIGNVTLVTHCLGDGGDEADEALAGSGIRIAAVNHVLSSSADLSDAVAVTARVGAPYLYLLTGGRGDCTWEQAAQRFAESVEPVLGAAHDSGVTLLVENASPFNADIHIAHTLTDVITLAEIANIGVCIDLHACWTEAGLTQLFSRAMSITGLVQVSDYVLGDRSAPCRAVPGDGAIPLRRLLAEIIDAGYGGVFDLELVGPRIDAEGPVIATERAATALSGLLSELGV